MGFLRQEYWRGLPFLPPGNLPDPGIEPTSMSPALQADYLSSELLGKPLILVIGPLFPEITWHLGAQTLRLWGYQKINILVHHPPKVSFISVLTDSSSHPLESIRNELTEEELGAGPTGLQMLRELPPEPEAGAAWTYRGGNWGTSWAQCCSARRPPVPGDVFPFSLNSPLISRMMIRIFMVVDILRAFFVPGTNSSFLGPGTEMRLVRVGWGRWSQKGPLCCLGSETCLPA